MLTRILLHRDITHKICTNYEGALKCPRVPTVDMTKSKGFEGIF
eukprot:UN02090